MADTPQRGYFVRLIDYEPGNLSDLNFLCASSVMHQISFITIDILLWHTFLPASNSAQQ